MKSWQRFGHSLCNPRRHSRAAASPPRLKAGKRDYYQPDEMEEIIKALESALLKWIAMTYLLIDTEARQGEILGLKLENVNYKEGYIIIDNALLYI